MNEILYQVDRQANSKTKADDRILVLLPIEEGKVTTNTGMVDNRLFSGENKLHVFQDPSSLLWRARYEAGVIPPALKQGFTSYQRAYDVIEKYFAKRGVKIDRVID